VARVHYLQDEIAVVGWSCRLPGANCVSDLWSLLLEGRCSISQVPADRFPLAPYGHPRRNERGKSYTWAAGVLDDVFGFDPSVFGISPREAEQMDPQQRILLQLTWEALEDAGIRPSSIAGTETGVFVGASQTDYAHAMFGDQAIADKHFATGNALAILANRISYIYDLHGPSVTLDTACSSSLVALHQAAEALRSGRIDTAIVGGINVIASSAEFVSFSQASMLSPTGLCRAFSADADGYVRAEGGAVLILRRGAQVGTSSIRGVILASDVNSDGRTNGISLPSEEAQEALLKRVYSRAGIDPNDLAFVEAHGTGTPVGDPIEALALGRSLGHARSERLPIGSIKTNIGHVEAASGLAGLIKALLALNHGVLPRSLHISEPNPKIDLKGLNLALCEEPLLLTSSIKHCAGINSFGFGGTNAHVVVAPGTRSPRSIRHRLDSSADFFAFSAATKPALIALAQKYLQRVAHQSDQDTAIVANAIAYQRDHLATSLAISTTCSERVGEALHAFIAGAEHPQLEWGVTVGNDLPLAFVYTGNGSQWQGMGIVAYRRNARFRAHFDDLDDHFQQLAGWSLKKALLSDRLAERLPLTRVAQPLIFAIQSAATAALRARGVQPSVVLGHSVGEVAAAEAAGILDLRTAVEVIYFRSKHQELVHGLGRMAAVLAPLDAVKELLNRAANVEIAAINSPRTTTVAGPAAAMARLKTLAKDRAIPLLDLDLDYPFHTTLMAPVEIPLTANLEHITPRDAAIPFVSTVTGSCVPGSRLGADYWWRNIRESVQFADGIRAAARLGARFFVEIGPRSMLGKHITDTLAGEVDGFAGLSVLDRNDPDEDPVNKVVSKALISGALLDIDLVFGPNPSGTVPLPSYPWQQEHFRYTPSSEAIGVVESERHPFSGARYSRDGLEWHAHIDTLLFPDLADHKVGEQVIFPGAGFLEIAFAIAREWLQSDQVVIAHFEILTPLDLTDGETREVMSRVSPVANIIEIFSRPRLLQASWLLHCRAKMLRGDVHAAAPSVPEQARRHPVSRKEIYGVGDACGLHYGSAFRLLDNAVMIGDGLIRVGLTEKGGKNEFVLDPFRLDACCHGLLTLFSQLRAAERGVSYLPVRSDEAVLLVSGGIPDSALIEVLSQNDRSIHANYYIFGSKDELIAILRGVRCQAVQVRRSGALEANAFVELPQRIDGSILGTTGLAIKADVLVADAWARGLLSRPMGSPSEEDMLEGWATAAAYEIASGLSDGSVIDIDVLVASSRLPAELRPWLAHLLFKLQGAGLAEQKSRYWVVLSDPLLPHSASVVKELARKHPGRAVELLIAGAVTGLAEDVLRRRGISAQPELALSPAVLDFFDVARVPLKQASDIVERLIENEAIWPKDRAVKVLQVGSGPLTYSLTALERHREIQVTVLEPERRRRDLAQCAAPSGRHYVIADVELATARGPFDLVLAVHSLCRLPAAIGLSSVLAALAPQGLLVAIEETPTLFRDIAFGLDPDWFAASAPDYPVGQLRGTDQWRLALERAGFANVQAELVACGSGLASLLIAEQAASPHRIALAHASEAKPPNTVVILDASNGPVSEIGAQLNELLRQRGVTTTLGRQLDFSDPVPDTLIRIQTMDRAHNDNVVELTARCLEIKACAERFGSARGTLWLVFRGALAGNSTPVDPIETGVWAFSRTLANEFPHLDVRRVDLAPHAHVKTAVMQLRDIIVSGTAETELQIDGTGIRAVRADTIVRTLDSAKHVVPSAVRLKRRLPPGQRFQWDANARSAPGADEVEIAVEATGLNFRDLMWMLSLLPDDIIDRGVVGSTFGCECAGRIIRTGANIRRLQPGDRVVAFAASAFSTHVTVPAAQVAKLPERISCEAGATIPVAFLTAYYSLITLAKLKRGEWILIHGAAGGVGLAVVQIARARHARIIATAGSKAKRELLRSLGVDHVLDSRSNRFVDDVRTITGSGVDVLLNSLAGEAMERSLACVGPFGRFVELGKRDYANNTQIGLRPFRNNISYFGVDVDQMMLDRRHVGRKIYSELMQLFESGTLIPLPYSTFHGSDLAQAFHLMQHSGHIGKIVVRPPTLESIRQSDASFTVDPCGTHVITGAFGGFGLEAAKWLVKKGARHLVLLGRRGAATEQAKAALADFALQGVEAYAAACDVADRRTMEMLFEHVSAKMPPIVGILHAAMVLDDGLLSNLNKERFHHVLAPKVKGADNLDSLTRGMALDYFVLFSSATTLMGNPGQANYVAANAYMEGIARRRRQAGLAGLAIGWGPITDVGVLARSERLRSRFQKLTGVGGMRASYALDLMAQALAQPPDPALAVITISSTEGIFTADRLQVLGSPTYANLVAGTQARDDATAVSIDLHAIARDEGLDGLRLKLTDVVVAGLARVLHAKEVEITRVRPLGEIGLDSLMALEFAMNLEDSFGIHVPMTSAIGGLTAAGLVNEIICQLNLDKTHEGTMVEAIVERHVSNVDQGQVSILEEIVSDAVAKRKGLIA